MAGSFVSAIGDLFKSIFEFFTAILSTVWSVVEGVLTAIVSFFTGIVNMVGDVLGGVVNALGGVGKFVASAYSQDRVEIRKKLTHAALSPGNIIIIGILAAGAFVYVRTQQGRPVVPAKKTN
jgi:phage-related protein